VRSKRDLGYLQKHKHGSEDGKSASPLLDRAGMDFFLKASFYITSHWFSNGSSIRTLSTRQAEKVLCLCSRPTRPRLIERSSWKTIRNALDGRHPVFMKSIFRLPQINGICKIQPSNPYWCHTVLNGSPNSLYSRIFFENSNPNDIYSSFLNDVLFLILHEINFFKKTSPENRRKSFLCSFLHSTYR